MKNHALIILSVLLLIAGVIIYLQIRSASLAQRDRNLEAKEFRNKAKEQLTKITQRDTVISRLLNDRMEDSVRHNQTQGALKTKINRLLSRVTEPAVVQDTIIQIQQVLISDLENEKDTLYLTDNAVLDSLQRSVMQLKDLYSGELKNSMRLEDDLKRERKKRWSVGPHAGADFRGATVGISVQYSLFRF